MSVNPDAHIQRMENLGINSQQRFHEDSTFFEVATGLLSRPGAYSMCFAKLFKAPIGNMAYNAC